MHYIILVKIYKQLPKEKIVLKTYAASFDVSSNQTVAQLKTLCYSKINNLGKLTKVKEDFWVYDNKITDDNQIISSTNGLEYDLYVQ
jgi:hypothetical protein